MRRSSTGSRKVIGFNQADSDLWTTRRRTTLGTTRMRTSSGAVNPLYTCVPS